MKKRKKAVLLFASALCICLSGCSLTEQQPVETEASAVVRTETVEKAESSLEDYHLRENKTIYEQDDETSVVTMYLTVREGNEAEHTHPIHGRKSIPTPNTGMRIIISNSTPWKEPAGRG